MDVEVYIFKLAWPLRYGDNVFFGLPQHQHLLLCFSFSDFCILYVFPVLRTSGNVINLPSLSLGVLQMIFCCFLTSWAYSDIIRTFSYGGLAGEILESSSMWGSQLFKKKNLSVLGESFSLSTWCFFLTSPQVFYESNSFLIAWDELDLISSTRQAKLLNVTRREKKTQ